MNLLHIFKPTETYVVSQKTHFKRDFWFYVSKNMNNGDIELWAHSQRKKECQYLGVIKRGLWHMPKDYYELEYLMSRNAQVLAKKLSRGINQSVDNSKQ